ncbi:MAG: M67 family metallopeptidase [Altererythrobacter sp.]|nr:M67 family metallopeptidase [Altererythrobacter sp.]MBT8431533.1 M67 family metallopeptidase [Altererythrobacter sp.]NNE49041.1 M67 family metallopeptidase [Altererythrobacter sp.]NNF93051.1 M67 family metallopeptidase [Altererythrobacter sp.]NNK46278.1 M67 family metallopeptidase [Altererythrobacter sp.]
MQVDVASHVVEAMQREALAAYPREACGILLGESDRISEYVATRNVHPTPNTHFEIDPQALIDAHRAARRGGAQVIGYYHSHPSGEAQPSMTDRAMASGDRRIWAILAEGSVRFWCDGPDGFAPLSYQVTGQ